MDLQRERVAPKVRVGAIKENATHARFGRVGGAKKERVLWNDFGQVGGPVGEVFDEREKGKEVVTDLFCDPYSVGRGAQVHGALQRRKEGSRAGHYVADKPEFRLKTEFWGYGPNFGVKSK